MPPLWTSDDELFARAGCELFSAVIGDTLDLLGHRHQFLAPEIVGQTLQRDQVRSCLVATGFALGITIQACSPIERDAPLSEPSSIARRMDPGTLTRTLRKACHNGKDP